MKAKIFNLFILATITLFAGVANAQSVRKNSTFDIKVTGTSNLHDWTMNAKSGSIDANLNTTGSYLAGIQSLNFSMPVKNMKSESSLMDSRAYDALKAGKFPTISFKLISATPVNPQGNKAQYKVTGQLSIAGATKDIVMIANSQKNADGGVIFTGTQKIKFSQFGLKAPSFMFGALKVGDDVTVEYKVNL